MATYILFESASGYALFERVESDEIGAQLAEVQKSVSDLSRFSKVVKLKAFLPFTSAEDALAQIQAVSEGEATPELSSFLEMNLPKAKPGKKSKYALMVQEPRIGNVLQETMGIRCVSDDLALELMRGVRKHFTRFIKGMEASDIAQAQLGLSHSYSRSQVKFNVNKADNMIIQAIATLDGLEKDLNTFAMRVREWYSWHFPELIRVVPDNYTFCRLATFIGNKSTLDESRLDEMTEITGDKEKSQEVLEAARMSMGADISEIDLINVSQFAVRVVKLSEYRKQLHEYLISRMNDVAPNLSALIGEQVGARLISHAGSLTNLAKYPASTVQILGAEKALFRALKTKGNTPKYGLIFHSTFIGRAAPKNKGRISRYLANKASISARIDAFSEGEPTDKFGKALRAQVEERLEFYKTGKTPRKNAEAMSDVLGDLGGDITRGDGGGDDDADMEPKTPSKKEKKSKKDKKSSSKKRKRSDEDDEDADEAAEEAADDAVETPKKSSKKEKKSEKKSKKKKARKD